jgi:hypothetical protein
MKAVVLGVASPTLAIPPVCALDIPLPFARGGSGAGSATREGSRSEPEPADRTRGDGTRLSAGSLREPPRRISDGRAAQLPTVRGRQARVGERGRAPAMRRGAGAQRPRAQPRTGGGRPFRWPSTTSCSHPAY